MVSFKDLKKSKKNKGKGVDYDILKLLDSVGDSASLIKKYKKKKIPRDEFKIKVRERLARALGDVIRLGNDLDVDLEKQFEVWWEREKKEKRKIDSGVVKGYDILASEYDTMPNVVIDSEENDFYKLIGNVKNKKILDVGCGTGRYSIPLAKKGAEVEGIDISPGMLRKARRKVKRKNLKIKFKKSGMTNLPYEDNSFDLVISSLAIDHVKDFDKAIKEMTRVCKNKGHIIISTIHPSIYYKKAQFETTKRMIVINKYPRSIAEFVETLNKNGALIKKIKEIKIAKKCKKINPEVYALLKNQNLILLIKAQKYNSVI